MNPDGTMSRGEEVTRFAQQHGLPCLTIAELVAYRLALSEAHARDAASVVAATHAADAVVS
jgi:3,4-dihydroxy 2-butanone 4-phosphate synthase